LPGRPRMPTHEPPRVVSPAPPTPSHPSSASPSWSPPPRPASSTYQSPPQGQPLFQATPRQVDFTSVPSPRVESNPQLPLPLPQPMLPAREPVAHRTQARAPAPKPLVLFTSRRPLHECFTYQMPTAKTTRSKGEPIGFAGLCSSMPATEVPRFAGLCQALSFLDMPEALSVLDPIHG
jgi:hypothetical protein